jgi:hypothetical protein
MYKHNLVAELIGEKQKGSFMDVKSVTSIAKIHIYITSHFVKKTNRMRFICTTLHRRQIAQYARREKKEQLNRKVFVKPLIVC